MKVKEKLKEKYRLKDIGPVSTFLGIQIEYNRQKGTPSMSQNKLITDLMQRYGMHSCHGISAPLDKSFESLLLQSKYKSITNQPYRQCIGTLMYLAICSRPGISYAVSVLSRYCKEPTEMHWNLVKRVI